MNNDIAIGIDLGTTYSCVAVYLNGDVKIIPNDQGNRTTPSYVAFTSEERLVGDSAENQVNHNPENTIFDAKRLIGRHFNDPSVQSDMKHWPFKIIEEIVDDTSKIKISVEHKGKTEYYNPEEISAAILSKMKESAENYLGRPIKKAVITVPAYFNDSQRRSTKDAGAIAGLEVLRIINEPTAAAIAYGLNKTEEKNVLVFDLGGGTFDVSLLTIDDGLFQVKATAGDTHLGGEDFDNKLVIYCLKEFKKNNKQVDINKMMRNKRVLRRLRSACEKAKRILSSTSNAQIEVDALYEGRDFITKITRAKFEGLCFDDFNRCMEPVEKVLNDSGINKDQIDDIVLVGGSTRIPRIIDMLRDYFKKEPKRDINPDEAVAYGAAIQAAILSRHEVDEKIDSMVLIDVAPLSLGLETAGGIMTKLINRNNPIPCSETQIFSTYSDNQPSVSVKVYEGERELTKYNNLLGTFELTGLPSMPRGVPKIHVKFSLDTNGILQVNATEESTGNSKNIVIKNDHNRFTKEELAEMIDNADKMAKEDKMVKERIDAINNLENYIYNTRNILYNQDMKNRLGENNCIKINEILIKGVQWLDKNNNLNKEDYEIKQKEIENLMKPILVFAYQNNQNDKQENIN